MKPIPQHLMDQLLNDAKVRSLVTSQKINVFFPVYFPKYLKYPMALMHDEILNILGDPKEPNFILAGFRGCAKSTFVTMVYPIWSIVGDPGKKYIVLVAKTQQRAKQMLKNIKTEFENNELLKQDFGEFEEEGEEWASYSLILPKYDAKITAVSIQESIRGIRYKQYRPDLLIFDDVEDLDSVKTQEGRDNTSAQIKGQFLPAGEKNTRVILIGNLLHLDSIIMRYKKDISLNRFNGVYREYPLIDSNGACMWPGRYPTLEDIEEEKKLLADEAAWMREYMLTIIPDSGQIIRPEWILYYNPNSNDYRI